MVTFGGKIILLWSNRIQLLIKLSGINYIIELDGMKYYIYDKILKTKLYFWIIDVKKSYVTDFFNGVYHMQSNIKCVILLQNFVILIIKYTITLQFYVIKYSKKKILM